LVFELAVNPRTRKAGSRGGRGLFGGYAAVLSNPFARIVLIAGFLEGGLAWGAFTYIGAYLHLHFGLSFSLVGGVVACFGIGGLIYVAMVKLLVYRLGQAGLAVTGGVFLAIAYLALALGRVWWLAPIATTAIGLGFYMLHNTLQTNATQMTPQARGTAVGLFSSALYIGQTAGVAAGAFVIDRAGAPPLFLATAIALPALAIWFVRELKRFRLVERI
jgi:predicted MFS family arabinose efflux permease